MKVRNIKANSVIDTPPWTLNKPEVIFTLTADKKDNTDAFIHIITVSYLGLNDVSSSRNTGLHWYLGQRETTAGFYQIADQMD